MQGWKREDEAREPVCARRNLFMLDEWARGMKFTMFVGHSKERERGRGGGGREAKGTSGWFGRSRCRLVNNGHASGSRIRKCFPLASDDELACD